MLIERGLDPRDFTLLAFGGAGPLHASELMIEMGIPRAIVPNHPGQFSAYGFILADARVDRQRTTQLTSKRFDPVRATQVMQELVGDCIAELEAQGYTRDIQITRALEMRYLGQNYELELPIGFERFSAETTEQLWQAFHEAHKARFGFSIPGEIIEIVNYLATAVSLTPKPELRPIAQATGAPRCGRAARRRLSGRSARGADLSARAAGGRASDRWAGGDRGGGVGDGAESRPAAGRRWLRPSGDRCGCGLTVELEGHAVLGEWLLHREIRQVRQLRPSDLR